MSEQDVIDVLKRLQKTRPYNKLIVYDFNEKHPLFFIEADGSVWKVHGNCVGCQRYCCDAPPAAYPEFADGKGGCKQYVFETVDDKRRGRCKIQWNKPLGCAMYPFNDPKQLGPHRASWDEKNCQYKLERLG